MTSKKIIILITWLISLTSAAVATLVFFTACGNTHGQTESTVLNNKNTALPREHRAVELVVSGPVACARTLGGKVACWRLESQLEQTDDCNPSISSRCSFTPRITGLSRPRWVSGLNEVKSIDLGGFGAAICEDGSVKAWDPYSNIEAQALTIEGVHHATQLAIGLLVGCSSQQNGKVWCWGGHRQFRNIYERNWNRAAVVPSVRGVISLSGDLDTMCAVRDTGEVFCWGNGSGGEITDEATSEGWVEGPVQIPGLNDALSIATGTGQTCALRHGGLVHCWGNMSLEEELRQVNHIDIENGQACVVHRNGSVRCWTGRSSRMIPGLDDAQQVSLSSDGACVLRANGQVQCWAEGHGSSLGNEKGPQRQLPITVQNVDDALSVATGQMSCALRQGGRITCWGPENVLSPTEIDLPHWE